MAFVCVSEFVYKIGKFARGCEGAEIRGHGFLLSHYRTSLIYFTTNISPYSDQLRLPMLQFHRAGFLHF